METRPAIRVAVRIERLRQPTRWEDWRFRVDEVVIDEGGFGEGLRMLRDDGRVACFLQPALEVALYPDEAEGYHLNLDSGAPVWFVEWRIDEDDAACARAERVTLSYNEAARWMDAQERVDCVPLPEAVRDWLRAYTDAHYRPEPRQRRRPASFRAPDQR